MRQHDKKNRQKQYHGGNSLFVEKNVVEKNILYKMGHLVTNMTAVISRYITADDSPMDGAGGGGAPDLFQGPDTLSPLTRMISPSSPTSSFSYSSSSRSSLEQVRQPSVSREATAEVFTF